KTDPPAAKLLAGLIVPPAIWAAPESERAADSWHQISTSIRLPAAASARGSFPLPLRHASPRARSRREHAPSSHSNTNRAPLASAALAPLVWPLAASAVQPISVPAEAAWLQKS